MKKNLFILTGILLFFAAVFYVISTNKSITTQAPPVVVREAPSVALQQPEGVTFAFATEPALPSSLPTYTFTEFTQNQLIQAVSKNLSLYAIPASPSSLLRSGTTTTRWSRDGADFSATVTKNSATVVFHQSQAFIKPFGNPDVTTTANQFIQEIYSLPAGVSLSQTKITDGPFDGMYVLDTFGASKFQAVNFSYTINGVPIATKRGDVTTGSVVVDNLGIIRSATLSPPPSTVAQQENVRLISKADILSNLKQMRASIVSGYNAKTAGLGDELTFRSFTIDKTTVVYGQQDGKLLPAFLLHGTGTDASGTPQEATYFLWATP